MLSTGFSFSRGHRIQRVPYDYHTPYVFDGELSVSRAVRQHCLTPFAWLQARRHLWASVLGHGDTIFTTRTGESSDFIIVLVLHYVDVC